MNGLDPAVCSQTDPTMSQPAALWPSPRNVLRRWLTIFSSEYYQILIATYLHNMIQSIVNREFLHKPIAIYGIQCSVASIHCFGEVGGTNDGRKRYASSDGEGFGECTPLPCVVCGLFSGNILLNFTCKSVHLSVFWRHSFVSTNSVSLWCCVAYNGNCGFGRK